MRRLIPLAALVLAAACSKKAPEPTPEPAPAPAPAPTPTPAPAQPTGDVDRAARERAEREAAERLRAELLRQLGQMTNYDYNKDEVLAQDRGNLDRKAAILLANPGLRIRIAGHCDERGSDEYNFALGQRRAESAKRYLVGRGVDAARVETVSFGKERPLDPAGTEDAWARNRRGEFEVVSGSETLVAPR